MNTKFLALRVTDLEHDDFNNEALARKVPVTWLLRKLFTQFLTLDDDSKVAFCADYVKRERKKYIHKRRPTAPPSGGQSLPPVFSSAGDSP